MIKKIVDLMLDKRFFYFIPFQFYKRDFIKNKIKKIKKPRKILFAPTFDVESDFGLQNKECDGVKPFLSRMQTIAKQNATFFVQGNIANKFAAELKTLQKNHEIGLHGFNHELWGSRKWFLKQNAIPITSKEQLLRKSLELFDKNNLHKPTSFRAPYMVIDKKTPFLLSKYGFTADSSASSYLGVEPIITYDKKITNIPVSVNPIAQFSVKKCVPCANFIVFNMKNLIGTNNKKILNLINNILKYQVASNCLPHLVFLAHPWEFCDKKTRIKRLSYGSEKNYDILKDMLKLVESNFDIEYVTISQLAKKWKKSHEI